jgi:hypothetical protein
MTVSSLSPERLSGTWQLLRCEAPVEIQPGSQMQFAADGTLVYVIPTPSGAVHVPMRWRVGEGQLHTTLEDGSNAVSVGATISEAEVLVFDFGGPRAFFVRRT